MTSLSQDRTRRMPAVWRERLAALLRAGGAFLPALAAVAGVALWSEPEWDGAALALAVFALVWSLVHALSRRTNFGFFVAFAVFLSIWIASSLKYAVLAMNLHVYDAFLYLPSLPQLRFFATTFPRQALFVGAAALAVLAAGLLLWRFELPGAWRPRACLALPTMALAATLLAALPFRERNIDFFAERRFVFSAFLSSIADLPHLLRFQGVIRVAEAARIPPLPAGPIACRPDAPAPDIVLFLHESAMPPGVYPGLAYPEELAPFFASRDGTTRRLRVETFGGGTWLSDFSALTGLPVQSFGRLRNFAGQMMTGRLRHSLPQYLKACGYETNMVYPTHADFAGARQLYQSIGFDRVIDSTLHGAPDDRQRDAFYLDQVARILSAPAEGAPRRPRFVVASSMAPHGPWDFRFAPEALGPADRADWNGEAELDEYLWRLVLARRDRDAFRARLKADLPGRRILYVDYGDHQPSLAAMPLQSSKRIADGGRIWQLDPQSKAFETYYAIDAQGFEPALPDPKQPILEVAHLPLVLVRAAGLPLDPVFARRQEIMERCNGLYATCADQDAILEFQRWLVDSGWISQK